MKLSREMEEKILAMPGTVVHHAATVAAPLPAQRGRGVRHERGEMNKLEARYAAELDARKAGGEVVLWMFEAVTLRLAPRTTYTPDFMVMLKDGSIEFHEVKAFMEDDAAVKLKVAAAMFPFRFVLVKRAGATWTMKEIG